MRDYKKQMKIKQNHKKIKTCHKSHVEYRPGNQNKEEDKQNMENQEGHSIGTNKKIIITN